ncbi:TPA: hypothetical protein N0F65_011383 [Lagenidium giganteum]|uniref:Uncharacterized protein n=1 Tax=Lagenidium giganteum TaxID=4803 RepID=A0AAV2Z4M1_9STRA|nr:TPA: hypothetical protein N0F65_011383 [Lagenidium giganteum]
MEDANATLDGIALNDEVSGCEHSEDLEEEWVDDESGQLSNQADELCSSSVDDANTLREQEIGIIRKDTCNPKCVLGKARELDKLLSSLNKLINCERKVSVMTALSVSSVSAPYVPSRTAPWRIANGSSIIFLLLGRCVATPLLCAMTSP